MGFFFPPCHIPDHRWPWLPWRWQPAQHRQSGAAAAGSGGKHAGNTSTRRALPVTLCRSGEEQSGNAALSLLLPHLPPPTPPPQESATMEQTSSVFPSCNATDVTFSRWGNECESHSRRNTFPTEPKISSRVGVPGYKLLFPSWDSAPICQQTSPAGTWWVVFFVFFYLCAQVKTTGFHCPNESGMTTGSPITERAARLFPFPSEIPIPSRVKPTW